MPADANETIESTATIRASAGAIFEVLADPSRHAAIDGTGWVGDPVDPMPLKASGQIFRMGMYHPNHPTKHYQMANRVEVFEPPSAISWMPGRDSGDGDLRFGGWVWRYDLVALGPSETTVTLSYDWSKVSDDVRANGPHFPPFPPEHLDRSLAHLADLATA